MTTPNFEQQLHPSKDELLKAELASPAGIGDIQQAAVTDARKCMNAMKTVGAALTQSLAYDSEQQAPVFQALLEEAGRVSRILLIRWGHNPEERSNRWMLNVMEKSLLPYLTTTPLSDDQIDVLANSLVDRAIDQPATTAWEKSDMIDVAIFRGLSRLLLAQSDFDFGRRNSTEADLEDLRNLVVQSVAQAMGELCPALTPHEDRVTFSVLLLDQTFEVMEASWKKNASRAAQELGKLNHEQIKAWKRANPNGFSLKPVFDTFELNFGRLVRLTLSARKGDKARKK